MTPRNFERSLRAFVRRKPFRPFVVELVSGTTVKVDHPEAMVLRGGIAVYVSRDGTPTIFDPEGVCHFTTDGTGR